MSVKFSNNAVTTLTDAPLAGAIFFNVADASAFPTLGASDWTYVSLTSEVVKVTEIVGNKFTCDATVNAHAIGESVELRMTSELLNDFAEDTEALPLAGGTMTGDVSLGDGVKAKFGASDDLQIYHNGSNSYVDDVGTGNLMLRANNLRLSNADNSGYYLVADNGGTVSIRHNNLTKLATTSTGIDVTGAITNSTSLFVGKFGDGADKAIELGSSRTVDGNAYLDLTTVAGENDYSTRLFRASGVNGSTDLKSKGSGSIALTTVGAGPILLQTDNAERLRIDSVGNVGIGTSSPSYKLEVKSSSDADLVQVQSTASANNTVLRLGVSGDNAVISGSGGSTGNLAFKTYGTERMRITSTGKVGIGTTAPSEKLHVAGNLLLDTSNAEINLKSGVTGTSGGINWTFDSTGTNYASVNLNYDTRATDGLTINSGYPITIDSESYTKFIVGGTSEKMRITSAGNVGIGTASPVTGTNQTSLTINAVSYPNITLQYGGNSTGAFSGDSTGVAMSTYGARVLKLSTNSAERMRIDSAGNVGIGTTAPSAKLHISGINTAIAFTFGNTVPNNPLHTAYYGGNTGIGMHETTACVRVVGASSSRSIDLGHYNGGVVSHANWISHMVTNSAGNVGIGTTSPSSKLHLYKTGTSDNRLIIQNGQDAYASILALTANNDGGAAYNALTSNTNGGTEHWKIWGGAVSSTLAFSTGNAERMRIDSSGNVGIGTTSSTGRLNVNSGATSAIVARFTDELTSSLVLRPESGGVILGTDGGGKLHLATGGSALADRKITVETSGNVGIGTTNPTAKLDVAGDIYSTGFLKNNRIGYISTAHTVKPLATSGTMVVGNIWNLRDTTNTYNSFFHGGFTPYNAPDENLSWTQFRIKGRVSGQGAAQSGSITLALVTYVYTSGWTERSTFTIGRHTHGRGFRTFVTAWQGAYGTDVPGIGLKFKTEVDANDNVIFGEYVTIEYR